MTNSQRALARLGLILAALIVGILNGSVLAAPVLIFVAYLLSILVRQAQVAQALYTERRIKELAR